MLKFLKLVGPLSMLVELLAVAENLIPRRDWFAYKKEEVVGIVSVSYFG